METGPPAATVAQDRPRLSLCMIARDEADNLPRCLTSCQGVADEVVIVDTGSQDSTVDIAHRFGAVIIRHPWDDDFAAARNAGLDRARGDWILVLDADEELPPETRAHLPDLLHDPTIVGYILPIANVIQPGEPPELEMSAGLRLFRNHPTHRFAGALHEQILPAIQAAHPAGVIAPTRSQIVHHGYQQAIMQRRQKNARNLRIAARQISANPADPFACGALAIELTLAGEIAAAIDHFTQALQGSAPGSAWHAQMAKQLAAALCQDGRWADATHHLARVLPLYPRYTDLLYLYGLALLQLEQTTAAQAALTQCLLAGPAPCPPYTSVDPDAGGRKAQLAFVLLRQRAAVTPEAKGES